MAAAQHWIPGQELGCESGAGGRDGGGGLVGTPVSDPAAKLPTVLDL